MRPLYAQQKQSRILQETDKADEAFNVTENKAGESLKWEVWEFVIESLMKVWLNRRNESKNREWEKRNESLVKFRVPWQFCIAENY